MDATDPSVEQTQVTTKQNHEAIVPRFFNGGYENGKTV